MGPEDLTTHKGSNPELEQPVSSRYTDRAIPAALAIHHYHNKHQGLAPLIRSVSRVTTALAIVSSVFQLFFFLVVCSDMISKGFGLVVFFASVKTIN
jgi:hypothetical protein